MNFTENKNLKKEKIGQEAYVFNNFIDDFYSVITILVIVIVSVIAYFFLINPRYRQAEQTISSARKSINKEMDGVATYIGVLTKFRNEYDDISESDIGKIDDIIGTASGSVAIYRADLLINFRDFFANNDYKLTSLTVATSEAKVVSSKSKTKAPSSNQLPDGIMEATLEVTVEELNYEKFKNLLVLLESKARIVDVQSFECDENISTCTLGLKTYYFDNLKNAK